MPLPAGTRLGPYEVVAPLGAGGMGEVYRATDIKLGRQVALKVLPPAFARDLERMTRFEREAKVLASLNHPHIAAIYGLEENALVMELVEGQTLAERLAQGSIPLAETLSIARQISEALEYAHEKGIVHRDLKPANVKITPEDIVKVLDFGLAKIAEQPAASADPANSPTVTMRATEAGLIMGTAAYMSPEQASGKPVDRRSDIWSFGVVLWEMLCGRRLFEGETISHTLADVLKGEIDFNRLPAETPPAIRELLRRCLDRDVRNRLRDIGEARVLIQKHLTDPAGAAVAKEGAVASNRRRFLPWALAGALLLALAAVSLRTTPPAAEPGLVRVARVAIELPEGSTLHLSDFFAERPNIAITADATRIAYVSRRAGIARLNVRDLDKLEAREIPGTDSARNPVFSPDGQSLAFFAPNGLKRVSLNTGVVTTIHSAHPKSVMGSWTKDNSILFTMTPSAGISRIPAAGGKLEALTQPAEEGTGHLFPRLLPDRKTILFTVWSWAAGWDAARVGVLSMATGKWKLLDPEGAASASYIDSGHLVYARAGRLLAAAFDLESLAVTSSPVPVEEGLITGLGAEYAVSADGSLVFVPSSSPRPRRHLVWLDPLRGKQRLPLPPAVYFGVGLSPDGRRLAANVEAENGTLDLQVASVDQPRLIKLTFGGGGHWFPRWTRDGSRVAYCWGQGARAPDLFWTSADGSGGEEPLLEGKWAKFPSSWSPGDKLLAFTYEQQDSRFDIWILDVASRTARPWLQTPHNEGGAVFSPDGRWIAYVSDESERNEIYVRPFPGPNPRRLISTGGGVAPVWAGNGSRIFFQNGGRIMVADVRTAPDFQASDARVFVEDISMLSSGTFGAQYDVAADGSRILAVERSEEEVARRKLIVVTNWAEELRRKLRSRK